MASTEASTATPSEMVKPTPVQKKQSVDASGNDNGSQSPPTPVRKLSRSQSITTSTIPSSFILPPEMEDQWKKRRESLDNLNLDKIAPWMHLHDFSESDAQAQEAGSAANSSN